MDKFKGTDLGKKQQEELKKSATATIFVGYFSSNKKWR